MASALDVVRFLVVAVAVMMYHGGLQITTGGFMGVDTFFVLSGFLITSLLVSRGETLGITARSALPGRWPGSAAAARACC